MEDELKNKNNDEQIENKKTDENIVQNNEETVEKPTEEPVENSVEKPVEKTTDPVIAPEKKEDEKEKTAKFAKPEYNKTSVGSRIVQVILLLVIMGCIGILVQQFYMSWNQKKLAKEAELTRIEALMKQTDAPKPTQTETPTEAPTETPVATEKSFVIRPEFNALIENFDNNDIVGYLTIPDTTIDYPIVHTDNNDYYLHYDIKKQASIAGWPFMDYENDIKKEDKNTIIYGHNMKANTMFHALRFYKDQSFYEDHKYIYFDTLYENQVWEVFSYYKTDTNFYYIQVNFPHIKQYEKLIEDMQTKSLINTGVVVTKDDRILTLSTCSNQEEDTRYVVEARLLSEEEIKERGIEREIKSY